MKKFIYTMLLLAVAGMTMTSFVSCEEDEDDTIENKEQTKKEDYLAFKYWVSNDVLEVADVKVNGLNISLKFNTDVTILWCPGKVCELVALSGQQAKDADFSVTVELKPNWKDLVRNKKEFSCGDTYIISNEKGRDINFQDITAHISTFSRDGHAGDVLDQGVETHVPRLGFEYHKN